VSVPGLGSDQGTLAYQTIFTVEASTSVESWARVAVSVACAIIFLISLTFRIGVKTGFISKAPIPFGVGILVLIIGTIVQFAVKQGGDYDRRMLSSGQAAVAEGTIDRLDVRPKEGHRPGFISVDGVTMEYNSYLITQSIWNQAAPHGNLRVGCRARMWFIGSDILKLEVEPTCANQSASGL
jgi:hypothetical protein